MNEPLVLAITGASGAVYALRLLEVLLHSGHPVHLTVSASGQQVLEQELGISLDLQRFEPGRLAMPERLAPEFAPLPASSSVRRGQIAYWHYNDYSAPMASGSFLTAGMVICPCSGSTLSAVAHAASNNLIQRAADVHLKEHRKLILVPREAPLSSLQLDNLKRACDAGAVILPAMPGWYHGVERLGDLVDFIVARILDQLRVPHALMKRWGSSTDV